MGTRELATSDADLVEAIARGQLSALRGVWDRYSSTVHWVCAVYVPDAHVAHENLVATFLTLWASPLPAFRAPSLPEHLVAIARCVSRTSRPAASDGRATRRRIDRLADVQLTSLALLFSGEFRAEHATSITGCTQSDLGLSLRTVLTANRHDEDRDGYARARTENASLRR